MARSPKKNVKSFRRRRFVSAADAVKGLTRPAFSKRGFAESRLITEWDSVVGPKMAALVRPLSLSFASKRGFGGTLTLGVLGANALEAQHLEPQIMERVNAHYGFRAVSRIALRQVGAELFERRTGRKPVPQPRPEVLARLTRDVGDVHDDGLRDALAKLAENIAARSAASDETNETEEQSET